jgi:hypothetical protein
MRVVTSREFNQDVSKAKRFAQLEPVFVTDRGRPTHVLLGIDAYRELSGPSASILDGIAAPESSAPLVAGATPRGLGGRG